MKSGDAHYALNKRLKQKGYFRKYIPGSKSGQTCKASGCDSVFSSSEGEKKEIEEVYENKGVEKVKKKTKHEKHEAKETKAFEKKEDKKEKKKKK